ncbi:MAG TPA: hypothetical protein VMJ93_16375 [Verrucomicrobiae bacterium]|nr:hypothetical protein [Verrucomicrobiae bacterium]
MREKNFNAGLRGVLFESRHYERMGSAIWLFGWLVLRQTHQSGSVGWVLGGKPVSYREIEEETGFNRRTLERWMQTLRQHGYIETDAEQGGVAIRISKAKKFPQTPRHFAESGRKSAERPPQLCGANRAHPQSYQSAAAPIGSPFIADKFINSEPSCSVENQQQTPALGEREQSRAHENRNQNFEPPDRRNTETSESHRRKSDTDGTARPVLSQQDWEARRQWPLLRADKDEAVRRELAVGAGPEVRRR